MTLHSVPLILSQFWVNYSLTIPLAPFTYNEVPMAKRRNLKKEKALRNEAYARKFRKRNNKGRGGFRRFQSDNRQEDGEENNSEMSDQA